MRKQILTAIFVSFLAGCVSQLLICIFYDIQNPPKYNIQDEFRGLKYGIAIGINLALALLSLPALFLNFPKIRNNAVLGFLFWFLPRTVLIVLMFFSMLAANGSFDFESLITIPIANSVAWWLYYFKVRKKFGA